jgi:hypothetical protein
MPYPEPDPDKPKPDMPWLPDIPMWLPDPATQQSVVSSAAEYLQGRHCRCLQFV